MSLTYHDGAQPKYQARQHKTMAEAVQNVPAQRECTFACQVQWKTLLSQWQKL